MSMLNFHKYLFSGNKAIGHPSLSTQLLVVLYFCDLPYFIFRDYPTAKVNHINQQLHLDGIVMHECLHALIQI